MPFFGLSGHLKNADQNLSLRPFSGFKVNQMAKVFRWAHIKVFTEIQDVPDALCRRSIYKHRIPTCA